MAYFGFNFHSLHAQAARDAETHDSNYASYCWNISEHMTRENKRSASPGIVGWYVLLFLKTCPADKA